MFGVFMMVELYGRLLMPKFHPSRPVYIYERNKRRNRVRKDVVLCGPFLGPFSVWYISDFNYLN